MHVGGKTSSDSHSVGPNRKEGLCSPPFGVGANLIRILVQYLAIMEVPLAVPIAVINSDS